jgi:hypothetical protein
MAAEKGVAKPPQPGNWISKLGEVASLSDEAWKWIVQVWNNFPRAATAAEVAAGSVEGAYISPATLVSEAYIYIRDEKASGTDGGTFTSGAWRTRDLNTEVSDAGNNASLASNQITLTAGTYRFRASAPAFHVDMHKCRLQNVTDATTIQIGCNGNTLVSSDVMDRSFVSGRFTVIAGKALELQHQCLTTAATIGFGTASSFGVVEVYAEIEFWKEF